jgi:hypothetical protein
MSDTQINNFGSFVKWETASRDTVDFKTVYVDVADGDIIAGLLLSQIVFWHLPNPLTDKTKLRVKKKGHLWLAKGRSDWYEECRISPRQFDRASKILVDLGIIEKKNFMFAGMKTVHVRILQARFLELLNKHAGNAYDAGVRAEEAFVEEHESIMGMAEDAGSAWADAPEPVAMAALEGNPENGKPVSPNGETNNREDLLVSLDKSKETLSSEPGKEKRKCVRCDAREPVSQKIDTHGRCPVCLFVDGWKHHIGVRTPAYSSNGDKREYVGIENIRELNRLMTARLKDKNFRAYWMGALEKASYHEYLLAEAWFKPEYFVRNATNYTKILDGTFDSREKAYPHSQLERYVARKRAGLAS